MTALARMLAVVALLGSITNTHAQGNRCTTSNIQQCVDKGDTTPLLLFTDVQTIKLNEYCSNYPEVKRCRSPFADNCTDVVKKEYAGLDGKMAFICQNNGADYAKHIDCMHNIKRKKAELECYRTYKSGQADILKITIKSRSEWRDKYCQQTKTFVACTREAVASYCKKDSEIWTDMLTKKSLSPLMEALWCPDWRSSTRTDAKIDRTPQETAIKYWLLVVPGLVTAVVTALAIAIVHRLRHRKESEGDDKQPRPDAARDGTRARSRDGNGREAGRSRSREHANKKGQRNKAKAKKLNRSQSVPQPADGGVASSGRENRPGRPAPVPTRLDQSSSVYTIPEPSVGEATGGSVYEHIALQQVSPSDSVYETHGPTDKANVYATLAPDDTYTKLTPAAEASGSKKEKRKKSGKREENTYLRLSKKR